MAKPIVSKDQVASSIDSRIFDLILLPTEKCNFRCTYCYEDFSIGRMPEHVQKGIERLVERRANGLRILRLGWFGGEPLVAKDILLRIARHSKEVCEAHGVVFSGGLTTNGSLFTDGLLRDLAEVNHRQFQITLDGNEDWHDRTRLLRNGTGTFGKIWNNLLLIRDSAESLHVMLRLHVSGDNTDSLRDLLARCQAELFPSGKFSVHFHRISNLGGPGGQSVRSLSWDHYKEILLDLQGKTGVRSSSEAELVDAGEICYAAKPNSLLIRADGRVGKCTVALNDPRNHVGDMREDGTISFYDQRLQLWFDGFAEMDPSVLGCPLSSLRKDPLGSRRSIKQVEAVLV